MSLPMPAATSRPRRTTARCERMVQAGARPMTSLQYLLELQRDWARGETYDQTVRDLDRAWRRLRAGLDLRQDDVRRR